MKDVYTLIAYKRSGNYGGCSKGCCRPSHYHSDLQLFAFESIDELFNKAVEIHKSNDPKDPKDQTYGEYDFCVLVNGRRADSFTLSEDSWSDLWICDHTNIEEYSDEGQDFENKFQDVIIKLKEKIDGLGLGKE